MTRAKELGRRGWPPDGPLYESKNHWRQEVKKRVNLCVAMDEQKRVRRREDLFRSGARNQFQAIFGTNQRDKINTQDKFLLLEKRSSKDDTRLIAEIARMVS